MAINLRKIDPDLVYPLTEVAEMLGLSYGTVLKLKNDGKLKSLKIGGKYYVHGKHVLKYIGKGGDQSDRAV
jgi:excisionase family DNA binding protein